MGMNGIERIAAERKRQYGNITCWECEGTGKGDEILNHYDNTPTGTYRVCWRCKGKKVAGFDTKHDAEHRQDEIAWAAVCYAAPAAVYAVRGGDDPAYMFRDPWPWDQQWDKRPYGRRPTRDERIRQLEKAGALIAAEIDRLLV